MKQNKKKTVAGILAAVIFGLVALLCLPVIGICVWNSVDGSQNFTMPELFRLMWIWWDYCMMPLTAVAFFIVALVLSKTKRHS